MRVGTDIRLQRPIDGREDSPEAQLHVLEKKIEEVGNVVNENEASALMLEGDASDLPDAAANVGRFAYTPTSLTYVLWFSDGSTWRGIT